MLFLLLNITFKIPMENWRKSPSQKAWGVTKQPGWQCEAQGKRFFYPYYCLSKAMHHCGLTCFLVWLFLWKMTLPLPLRHLEAGICQRILAETKNRWYDMMLGSWQLVVSCQWHFRLPWSWILNSVVSIFITVERSSFPLCPASSTEFCILSHNRSLKLTAEESI